MKPYYQDDAVTIYHGDCRDVLLHLPPVDLVLTDPPYGIGYITSRRLYTDKLVAPIQGDEQYPVAIIQQCKTLAAVGVLAFARGEPMKAHSMLVWVKNNWSVGDLEHAYGNRWETILWWPGPFHQWRNGRPANVLFCDKVPPEQLQHPTEKPIALLRQLILQHKCDLILDPFMGSGTTLRAAKDLGRKAIGIEIEERYCEIAAKRMSQLVMELT